MSQTRLTEDAAGVYIIAATPFADDLSLDLESTDRLVDFYLGHGVHGMTILGIMGEAPKLTFEEAQAFVRRVLARVAGRVPVVVGVSSPGLAGLKALTEAAMSAGAAGVMVAPTPGLRGDEALYLYYVQVCEAIGRSVPVVLQDYPQATGVYLPVPLFARILADLPQIVMLKHEDAPGLAKLSRIRAAERAGTQRRVSILVGNGGIHLPQELARGADGAMTGFAWPEMLVQVCALFRAGRREEAEDLYDAYLPLIRHELQPGIGLALRKAILHRRGAIASPKARVPAPVLTAEDQAELSHLIVRLERRLGDFEARPAA